MEYKFRYYSEEYKELLPVLDIDFVNDCFYILPFAELEGGNQIEVKGIDKLEQCIDKQDRNGKDIFKGDKIKYTKYTCIVKYKNGHYYLDIGKEGLFWFSDMPGSMLEIIGTIHD